MSLWGRSMKKGKQCANKKIRRKLKDITIDIGNGHDYKRLGLDSWDLWEFNFYETKQDAISNWEYDQNRIAYGINCWKTLHDYTLEEAIQDWKKSYIRK